MKRYYRHETDSDMGAGVSYFEFEGDRATRQAEVYAGRWFYSDDPRDHFPERGAGWLTDQPPDVLGLTAQDEIAQGEFEEAWAAARGACSSGPA